MKQEEDKMAILFRAHDPVEISAERLARLHAGLLSAIEAEGVPVARLRMVRFVPSCVVIPVLRFAAMGMIALLLGLFIGQEIDQTSVISVHQDQKLSVLALADPWEHYIVERE